MLRPPPRYTPFPYTTLFRSQQEELSDGAKGDVDLEVAVMRLVQVVGVGLLNVVEAIAEPEALEAGSDQRIARLARSEEHTSELQSHVNLVCRLLLEKKNHLL